jgi:hypothetical protein
MRFSYLVAAAISVGVSLAGVTAEAGSRDRNPRNGDVLLGPVEGNAGGDAVMQGLGAIASGILGVQLPGASSQSHGYGYQNSSGYSEYDRDPGAPAIDFYADCRYANGQVDRRCVQVVDAKISREARRTGETFICPSYDGGWMRTQQYRDGCRLESKL